MQTSFHENPGKVVDITALDKEILFSSLLIVDYFYDKSDYSNLNILSQYEKYIPLGLEEDYINIYNQKNTEVDIYCYMKHADEYFYNSNNPISKILYLYIINQRLYLSRFIFLNKERIEPIKDAFIYFYKHSLISERFFSFMQNLFRILYELLSDDEKKYFIDNIIYPYLEKDLSVSSNGYSRNSGLIDLIIKIFGPDYLKYNILLYRIKSTSYDARRSSLLIDIYSSINKNKLILLSQEDEIKDTYQYNELKKYISNTEK